jgi:hypothetical protein
VTKITTAAQEVGCIKALLISQTMEFLKKVITETSCKAKWSATPLKRRT